MYKRAVQSTQLFRSWTSVFHRLFDCFIDTLAALHSWKFGATKGLGCAFSTWEKSDNFSPSSSFGLLSKLGNSLVSQFWRRPAHREVSISLKELHGTAAMGKGCLCCLYWEVWRPWLCEPGGIFLAVRWLLANLLPSNRRGSCGAVYRHHSLLQRRVGLYYKRQKAGLSQFLKWHLAVEGEATWTTTAIFLMNTRAQPTVTESQNGMGWKGPLWVI